MKTNFFKAKFHKNRLVLATRNSVYCSNFDDLVVIAPHPGNDRTVTLTSGTSQHQVLFDTAVEAKVFVDEISDKILRKVLLNQVVAFASRSLKLILFVSIIMFILNLNATSFRLTQSLLGDAPFNAAKVVTPSSLSDIPVANTVLASPSISTVQQTQASSSVKATPSKASPEMIGRALKRGVITGDYSVDLGTGNGPDLYVFADPLCPHCRDAESVFENLAKEGINVHIFPVSVITEGYRDTRPDLYDKTLQDVKNMLCLRGSRRAEDWLSMMTPTPPLVPKTDASSESCEAGGIALSTNNEMFHAIGLPGTPAIIDANGNIFSPDQNLTVPALKQWISGK